MGEPISFKGVKTVADKPYTRPGIKDIFNIKSLKFTSSSKKQTPGLEVLFDRKDDAFPHTFYLSTEALPKLKALIKGATGREMSDDDTLTEEQLRLMLENKKVALKTIGKINEETGKGYVDLGFGGFCARPEEIDFLEYTTKEQGLVDRALAAIERASRQPDDSAPTGGSEAAPGSKPNKW